MVKIAFLTPTFNQYSGIDRVVQQRAEEFSRKGHQVTIFAFEAKIKPQTYDLVVWGISKNAILQRVRDRLFLAFRPLNQWVDQLKGFDLVISFNYPMDEIARRAQDKYGVRYESWFSGLSAPGENLVEKIYMLIFKKFYYQCLYSAKLITCVSNSVKNEILERTSIPISRLRVDLNKIDTERFNLHVTKKYDKQIKKLIQKHDLDGKKIFLYVGRLATSKKVDKLIEAFLSVKKQNPDSRLMIVGEPTFKSYFKKLCKLAEEEVIFTGFVPDEELPAYFAVCDAFVTASSSEGFNLPAKEAQACGKKVIAFDLKAHQEVLDKNLRILVPAGDFKALEKSMINFSRPV